MRMTVRTRALPGSAQMIKAFCLLMCVSDQEPHTFTVLISLHLKLKYRIKPDSLVGIFHSIVIQAEPVHP